MISVRRRTLRLRMRSWFTQRLPAKIAALVLALLLWLVVTLQAPAEQWMEVRLDLTLDSGYALVDLDSTFGTMVNNARVTRQDLKSMDRITVGGTG